MQNEREEVLNLVREDGRNLETVSDEYKDDIEVVASAILGRDFGGISVLQYASSRLQHNKDLIDLTRIASKLMELRMKTQELKITSSEKSVVFQQIEDKKDEIIRENFQREQVLAEEQTRGPIKDYYLEGIEIDPELQKVINKGVLGTQINHPTSDMIDNLAYGIYLFLGNACGFTNGEFADTAKFSIKDFISRDSEMFGIPLRLDIIKYYKDHPTYPVMGNYGKDNGIQEVSISSDLMFAVDTLKMALHNMSEDDAKNSEILTFLKHLDYYLVQREEARISHSNMNIVNNAFDKLRTCFSSISVDDISMMLHSYFDSLDVKEVFTNPSIVIEEVTDTAREVFSNVSEFGLAPSFHATLLDGRIEMATDIGYQNEEHSQDDAVGSVVVDSTHYINIICDGAGGVAYGNIDSQILMERLLEWYQKLSREELDNVDLLCRLLNEEVYKIHLELVQNYGKFSITTLAVALTAGDETIIANIGDSTIYTYHEETDELEQLTVLDSYSQGLSYEEARHNPQNNVITAGVGYTYDGYDQLHLRVIDNVGQRIILSSDGVTDLISEENFRRIFRDQIKADPIIQKAKFHPDTDDQMKSKDNISLIIVDLPAREYSMNGRSR